MIGQMQEDAGNDDPAAAASEWQPSVQDVYRYTPKDKRTGRAGKPIEVEVQAVDTAKRTCTVKNLVDQKTLYKDVAWDALADAVATS
jgi:hypothetical protein